MKKILALLLCVIMLAGALASCKTGGPDTPDGTTTVAGGDGSGGAEVTSGISGSEVSAGDAVDIDLTKYRIIRAENPAATLLEAVIQMKKDIDALTGSSVELKDDWIKKGESPDDAALEILVGATNRQQSEKVLSGIEGSAFAIEIVGNKIVIIGTTDAITADGVRYFVENYVAGGAVAGEKKFSLPGQLRFVSDAYRIINMIDGKKCKYDIVYNDGLDNTADDKGKVDYQVQLAKDVRQKIIDLTGANVAIKTDWAKAGADTVSTYEVLIGKTARPESAQAIEKLGVDEYGVFVVGNKIVVNGWNEQTIGYAAELFVQMITEAVTTQADGTKNISFLESTSLKKSFSRWKTDIPEYEGGTLAGSVTCNNEQLEYYYTDTTSSAFADYRKKLEGAGYTLYTENEIEGNIFATYTSSSTMIHTYYVKYSNAVRIITGAKANNVALPENTEKMPEFTKITSSKITQMKLDYESGNFGMCYIITLEDGSFIIFDGGGSTGGIDHIRLYNLLNKLNERPDGKIVIAAWIMTHNHWDHYMVFHNFCTSYGSKVTIEQYILNVPDDIVGHNSNNPGSHIQTQFPTASAAAGGLKLVKPHTGMKFYVRNAEIEVLFTQEDIYPKPLHFFNDSTMVLRMNIGGQSVMWLGDVCDVGSDIICDMYGSYIKSDIVQVSHHGENGGTTKLYKLIAPLTAFWPCKLTRYKAQTAGTNTSGLYGVDLYVAKNLGVKDIFVADPDNISITLPYTAGSGAFTKIDVPTA